MIVTVPAIELVCLMHPTEHAGYSHQQARLKCNSESTVHTLTSVLDNNNKTVFCSQTLVRKGKHQ